MAYIVYVQVDPRVLVPRYVGYTSKTLDERAAEHLRDSRCIRERNRRVYKWWRSLAKESVSPVSSCIEMCETEAKAKAAEVFFIALFRQAGCNLTNGTDGGDGFAGYMHTPEQREKQAAKMSGRRASAETRLKMSVSGRGRPKSVSTREAMRDSHGGRRVVDEAGVIYLGASDAARQLGLNRGSVSRAARHPGYKVDGHSFRYMES